MAFDFFGFQIKRKSEEDAAKRISFSQQEDGQNAVEVTDYGTGAAGGAVASFLDLTSVAQSETELVNRYRGMASQPEIAAAIDHIINEMVYIPDNGDIVKVIPDDIEYSDKIKNIVVDEFDNILRMLDFSNNAYEIIRRWYVDGTLHYHIMVDGGKEREGIKELRYVDPRKLKKVRVYEEVPIDSQSNIMVRRAKEEHYVYSETGFNTVVADRSSMYGMSMSNKYVNDGIKIGKDSIATATSGLMDVNNRFVLSHLDQAFRPLNSLRIEEDATVIYRVARAPERRAFYIDVSGLPPSKAEAHVKQLMDRHNKKMQYNSKTGEIVDDTRVMTMTDDYWLPRKDGTRGTEIVPLAGGSNLGEMEDVLYFQQALYKALKVPVSRLQSETGSFLGRQSEISREEANFALFITRLRSRFTALFDELLEKQLILKKIIRADDWAKIKNDLRYDFLKNNFFDELKKSEILRERISLLNEADQFVGKYLSKEFVWRDILQFNDDEMKKMEKEIEDGKKKGYYDDIGMGDDPDDADGFTEDEPPADPNGTAPVTLEVSVNQAKAEAQAPKPKPEKPKTLDSNNKSKDKETDK